MNMKTCCIKTYEKGRAEGIDEVTKWLLKQMEKGKNAEKHAKENFDGMPAILQKLVKKEMGFYDVVKISLHNSDLEKFMHYNRMQGMADFILIELHLAAKELGIELKEAASRKGRDKQ